MDMAKMESIVTNALLIILIVSFVFALSMYLYPNKIRSFIEFIRLGGPLPGNQVHSFDYTIPSSDLQENEMVGYRFYAQDTKGNWNVTDTNYFTVQETTTSTTTPSGGGGGGGGGSSRLSKLWSTILANAENAWDIADMQLRVTQINFTSNVEKSNVRLYAQRLTSKPANISENLSGSVYQYIEITKSNIENSEIRDAKIQFKVDKSWLTSNGLQPSDISLARYSGGWADLQADKTGEDSSWVFYRSSAPGFSTFAIYAENNSATTTTSSTTITAETTLPVETTTTQPARLEGNTKNLLLIMTIIFLALVGVLIALRVMSKKGKETAGEDEFEQLKGKWSRLNRKNGVVV